MNPWTVAGQAPLSMGFPRKGYWSGLPLLLHRIFWIQGLNPHLLHWQVDSLPLSHQGRPNHKINYLFWVRKPRKTQSSSSWRVCLSRAKALSKHSSFHLQRLPFRLRNKSSNPWSEPTDCFQKKSPLGILGKIFLLSMTVIEETLWRSLVYLWVQTFLFLI